jgi:GntR family transcriptional regulator, rspAB operon transcriptional repressor
MAMQLKTSNLARTRQLASPRRAGKVFDQLREMIIALELAPGATLDRQELQEIFGVSSTPVRDQLLRLSEEGLVEIVPQSATRVSLIDISKAREAQFLRRALEIEVAKIVCDLPEKQFVQDLREIVDRQRECANKSNLREFDALDGAFHKRLFEAAGVSDLYALIRQRSGHIDRIRRLHLPVAGKTREVIRDHELIVKAIARSKTDEAQFRVRDHLSRSLAYSPKLREKYPTYFAD